MKRKLLSVVLAVSLMLTSAVCIYGANSNTPKSNGKDNAPATITKEEKQETEKIKNESAETEKIKNENTGTESETAKKERILEKKAQIRSEYTEEELESVNESTEKIKKEDPASKVLKYDSIISDDAEFKFDTPPVIKGGRTLVPARAITEGFGAELVYDQESQLVTVTKGDTVIELTLGSMVAVVNGEEVQMDTKANIVNNRTYVPLRFILETLKLNVEWDEETETIEISDDVEVPETTSGGAITTEPEETTSDGAITVSE